MKFWIKLIFKTLVGGFGAVLLSLSLTASRDMIYSLFQGYTCNDIWIFFYLKLHYINWWNDWDFMYLFLGVLFVLLVEFRFVLFASFSKKSIPVILMLTFMTITGCGIGYQLWTEALITKTYSGYCDAIIERDYALAYSYFSPEFRSEVGLGTFTRGFAFPLDCKDKSTSMTHHRLNGATLNFPYSIQSRPISACNPFSTYREFMLVRVGGRWYFTGEHHWYMD